MISGHFMDSRLLHALSADEALILIDLTREDVPCRRKDKMSSWFPIKHPTVFGPSTSPKVVRLLHRLQEKGFIDSRGPSHLKEFRILDIWKAVFDIVEKEGLTKRPGLRELYQEV